MEKGLSFLRVLRCLVSSFLRASLETPDTAAERKARTGQTAVKHWEANPEHPLLFLETGF